MSVTGIGGVFFRADDPAALKDWYRTHLGVVGQGWTPWEQAAGPTLVMPFRRESDKWAADRQWMINFRVSDLDGLIARLKAAGIEVKADPSWDGPEVGRFALIHDPEGNAVELWEPAPE